MKARYYDHNIGRFLSNDPVGFSESSAGTFNRYAYVENNPYRAVDPTGESQLEVFTELAPAAGRAFAGLAAWGVGHATGNDALVNVAIAGMASQQGDNLFAAASVFGLPGASKVRIKKGVDDIVYRMGTSKESKTRLGKKAQEAQDGIGKHGVSGSTTKPSAPCSSASMG